MRLKNCFYTLLCLGLLTILPIACSPIHTDNKLAATEVSRVWPAAPATPRIRLVGSVATPEDMGINPSFFKRILNKITGGTPLHLVRPTGVAEWHGILYVADPGAKSVWILDAPSNRTIRVQHAGENPLLSPVAVTVRKDGAVFVADARAGRVFLLDHQGKFLGIAAHGDLQRPVAVAYDEHNQKLYVADAAAQKILVYDNHGKQLLAWGKHGSAQGEFNYPTYLGLRPGDPLLVTDALNFRIQAFNRQGQFQWQFGHHGDGSGSFSSPKGVAEDSGQHIYVVDALFDTVQIFDTSGRYLLSFGEHGAGPGQFWLPGGIFINAQDRIFVADSYNHRIQIFEFIHTKARQQS